MKRSEVEVKVKRRWSAWRAEGVLVELGNGLRGGDQEEMKKIWGRR